MKLTKQETREALMTGLQNLFLAGPAVDARCGTTHWSTELVMRLLRIPQDLLTPDEYQAFLRELGEYARANPL